MFQQVLGWINISFIREEGWISVRFQPLFTFNKQQFYMYIVFPGLFHGYSRAMNIYTLRLWPLPGLEINFVENWPVGHLNQILTGQTVSFTGHM